MIRADSTFIVTTLSELKIACRSLLYKVHPDRGFSGSFRGWWWVSHRLDWDSVFFRRLCEFGPFSIPFSGLGSAPFGASLYVGVGVEHRCSEVSHSFLVHALLDVVVIFIQFTMFLSSNRIMTYWWSQRSCLISAQYSTEDSREFNESIYMILRCRMLFEEGNYPSYQNLRCRSMLWRENDDHLIH